MPLRDFEHHRPVPLYQYEVAFGGDSRDTKTLADANLGNLQSVERINPTAGLDGGSRFDTSSIVSIPARLLSITGLHRLSLTTTRGVEETLDLRAEEISIKVAERSGTFEINNGEETQMFNYRFAKKIELS